MTTPLAEILRTKIRAEGPLPLSDYMELCLTHPQYGYYTTHNPFGAAGDFTTAPEMTQAFGELLGLWAVEVWRSIGQPSAFTLAEFGPGRGTLMADALRAARMVPEFEKAAQVYMLESSPLLRKEQQHKLTGHTASWITTPTELPDQPLIVFANEFFDALPIRQFQRANGMWMERRVGLGPQGQFIFVLAEAPDTPFYEMEDGSVLETCPSAAEWASAMARPILKHRGAGLIIDYGDDEVIGDTLQAVQNHRRADVLATPGDADITAHVSFTPLASAVRKIGCRAYGPIGQGEFLLALGLVQRTAQLCAKASEEQQRSLKAALTRLTDATAMGSLFRVLAFADKASPTPPGLD